MNPRRRLRLERLGALAGVLLVALGIGLWHPGERGAFWQGIEGRLLDARFHLRGPLPAPTEVAIVTFDDAAAARLAAFPPSRTALATAVADAWASGARVLAMDFLWVDERDDDAVLAAALARGDAVIGVAEAAVGAPAATLRDLGGLSLFAGPVPERPLPALGPAPALQAVARLGHVTVAHGPDGALRRMRPAVALAAADGVAHVPGLAVAAVAAQAGGVRLHAAAAGPGGRLEIGPALSLPLDLGGSVPLDFYGPAGTIPTHSAAAVTAADLRGKIVFLGATATGFGDRHATPFDATLPGVEVHATFAANLLAGRHLRRDALAWAASAALAVLAATAGFMAAGLARPLVATTITAVAAAAVAAALQAAFVAGWWLDAATVLLALAWGAAVGAALQRFDQRRRAARLARFQAPALVEVLATEAEPLRHRPPQPAVVLFVDVSDFTPHAERWGPQGTHAFLSLFTRLVEQAAGQCGGMVADFAGDGALIVFGVPERAEDDADRALRFVEQLLADVRDSADWPGLGLRVSGHAGMVQLGVVGGDRHRRVSVSGDVVNTASRLQECAREHGAVLALSAALVATSSATTRWAGRMGLRKLPPQLLRGRAMAEEVWVGGAARPGGRSSKAPGELPGT